MAVPAPYVMPIDEIVPGRVWALAGLDLTDAQRQAIAQEARRMDFIGGGALCLPVKNSRSKTILFVHLRDGVQEVREPSDLWWEVCWWISASGERRRPPSWKMDPGSLLAPKLAEAFAAREVALAEYAAALAARTPGLPLAQALFGQRVLST